MWIPWYHALVLKGKFQSWLFRKQHASFGQVLEMLTISSWHKCLWLSTCAVQDWRGFSWSQIGFSNHFGGPRLYISPSSTQSCNKITTKHTTWALQTTRTEVKAGLDQVLQNSPDTGMPAEGLLCRKLLSPMLGSGSAALSTKEKAHKQQTYKCKIYLQLQPSPGKATWPMGMIPMLGKSSKNAELYPALGQRFPPAFGVETPALWASRGQQRHTNPTTLKPLTANTPSSPYSQSASAHTMQGFFPPSSNVTLLRLLLEAASLISFPTCISETQRGHELFPLKISSVIPTRVEEPGWQLKQVEVRENTLKWFEFPTAVMCWVKTSPRIKVWFRQVWKDRLCGRAISVSWREGFTLLSEFSNLMLLETVWIKTI